MTKEGKWRVRTWFPDGRMTAEYLEMGGVNNTPLASTSRGARRAGWK